MKRLLFIFAGLFAINATAQVAHPVPVKTFCNPINLPYNFQKDGLTRREAADPTIVLYKNRYWLFASKQQGYWFSEDMLKWTFVKPEGLPLNVYAPSITVVNGKLYYFSGDNEGAFTTDDPAAGKWININRYAPGCTDPDLFQDSDGKVYLYAGCSDKKPTIVTQMDPKTFLPVAPPITLISANTSQHGWEVPGDDNRDLNARPWIEGTYMNKIGNKYYLQYAGPGTQFKTYGDGVYVADKPTGLFTYADYSPFSFKPTGFITGAGHSGTFMDKQGQYWHIATGTISIRHMFERRLVLFPTFVTPDGQLVTDTYLGDYPQLAPGSVKHSLLKKLSGWMLLSYHKKAQASSVLKPAEHQSFVIGNAFDEDIRTWWSAATGKEGEWLQVDLDKNCTVNAIQINFADQDAVAADFTEGDGYRYDVKASVDGKTWTTLINRRNKGYDAPHDYIQFDNPVKARYLRITNVHCPAKGLFSIYDLRVFGKAPGKLPAKVSRYTVVRDTADRRRAHIKWQAQPNTDFYIVRYGIAPDKLYGNYQVYDNHELDINALNSETAYYFTVDAVNATGITPGNTSHLLKK